MHQQNLPVGLGDGREGAPSGGALGDGAGQGGRGGGGPAPRSGISTASGSSVSLVGLVEEGEAEEFGEMTGASPAAAADGDGKAAAAARAGVIRLSATAGAAGGHAAPGGTPRRVQFADAAVIDVRSSDGGGGASPLSGAGSPTVSLGTGAPVGLEFRRQPSLLEVELASGASPLISPRDGPSSSAYSSWLHD